MIAFEEDGSSAWLDACAILEKRYGFARIGKAAIGAGQGIHPDFCLGRIQISAGWDNWSGDYLLANCREGDQIIQELFEATKEPAIIPRDKSDLAAANAAAMVGWPAIEPFAEPLLAWVQDANWPVAQVLAPFLASVGVPLVPHIRQVLAGEDEGWKYSLIATIVAQSRDLTSALRPELERIAFEPTPSELAEEVSDVAREALEQS